ncbi:hypothetical protein GOODEAATRI_020027 [Goodea atripinnis]|uniref:Transposase n=1 Tax=Goodea atripinnis TaxID=208336 RepID=A0ABV0N543_9TELE
MLARPTTETVDRIPSLLQSFQVGAAPPVQLWLRLLGMLVRVTPGCAVLLHRWRDEAYLQHGVPLTTVPARQEVVTMDASPLGWGAMWQCKSVQGLWGPQSAGRGAPRGTLKVLLSAISASHDNVDGRWVGTHYWVSQVLQVARRLRPPFMESSGSKGPPTGVEGPEWATS